MWSTGSRHTGFRSGDILVAVFVHELRCSVARGIFPDQGLNPCHPHEQPGFSTAGPPGKSEKSTFPAWSLNMSASVP